MPLSFFQALKRIFNWCLKNGYFPAKANVIPVLKSGKEVSSPKSYRPISMLTCLDKIFEKIVLNRVEEFTETNGFLLKEQRI